MPDALADAIAAATSTMVALRHDLHQHPELSFEEHRTTEVITRRLEELGWWLEPCPTPTGAVATMRGTAAGRSVMIRADIDALPVTELRDLAWRSTAEGVMHACGHDVHAAALLGVAEVLASMREGLAGDYTLVFQPAEEAISGALALVEGGLLERHRPDVVIGAHVTSLAPLGFVATRPGVFMSEATSLRIEIAGRGGHGAMATREGSVVLAAAELTPRIGEIVEGLETEGTACACSIGVIHAGTRNNVVPRAARLEGTLRTFTPEQHQTALARLDALLDDVARDFAVTCELFIDHRAPATVNDAGVTARVVESARAVVGAESVLEVAPVTPSEDVSEFLNRVPGCYLFVGGALEDGTSGPHHSPEFAVEDRAVAVQAHVLARAAMDLAAP